MKKMLPMLAIALVACAVPAVQAQKVKVETVVDGLKNPCGVAVHPETGDVYVADSAAGRVVVVKDGKAHDVITDFPVDVYGKGPKYNIGPLGLAFLDAKTLVVGGGGYKDGEELLRVFTLPADGKVIKADAAKTSYKLAATDDIKGEGNFYGLAVGSQGVYVTCNGDDTKGWVSLLAVKDGKTGPFKRTVATKEAVELDAPVGITVHPKSKRVVVGQMGEITVPGDGMVTFYHPKSGKMLANYEVGLSDITALAYSPERKLYALDFAWTDIKQAGLFRLSLRSKSKEAPSARKIAGLRGTAMAFGKDGTLYITVVEQIKEGSQEAAGKLVKIAPGL